MSNHFSAANLKYPGDDARLDLTDLFVFQPPGDPGRTVLIIDVNPFMTGSEFHPDAVYRINIDNDGDLHADAAFTFVFSQPADGAQTGTAYYATGSQARQPEPGEGAHPGHPGRLRRRRAACPGRPVPAVFRRAQRSVLRRR